MSHPAADRIVGLYQDRAADWIRDRGAVLRRDEGDGDEAAWLDRFLAGWAPGARVLDVGCGSGWPMGAALLQRGFEVVGLDASPGLIAHARETLPNGDWRIGDMRADDRRDDRRNGLPDEALHGVLAWHSLFHLTPEAQTAVLPMTPACARAVG